MDTSTPLLTVRNARIATAVALAAFIAFIAAPDAMRVVTVAVMVTASAAVVACTTRWMQLTPRSKGAGGVALLSAVGLVASMAYLSSLADEPSAIPIAGTLVLLLSLVGLVVSLFTLHDQ